VDLGVIYDGGSLGYKEASFLPNEGMGMHNVLGIFSV
jgi:hypothetical protein